jgi:hypothetical protein
MMSNNAGTEITSNFCIPLHEHKKNPPLSSQVLFCSSEHVYCAFVINLCPSVTKQNYFIKYIFNFNQTSQEWFSLDGHPQRYDKWFQSWTFRINFFLINHSTRCQGIWSDKTFCGLPEHIYYVKIRPVIGSSSLYRHILEKKTFKIFIHEAIIPIAYMFGM